jgi:uncharacterized membrane protein
MAHLYGPAVRCKPTIWLLHGTLFIIVLALAFTVDISALSTSAFARGGGFGGGHITIRRDGDHNGHVSRVRCQQTVLSLQYKRQEEMQA